MFGIVKEHVHTSPTASFFESLGFPSKAASKMSISSIDDRINQGTRKSDAVVYDNRINPCECALCRVDSPYFEFQLEASTKDGKKLPVVVTRFDE